MNQDQAAELADAQNRLHHMGAVCIALSTFLETARAVDVAGGTAFIIADSTRWEILQETVAKETQ